MTPKRRLLTLIFACLCFKKSLLIKTKLTSITILRNIFKMKTKNVFDVLKTHVDVETLLVFIIAYFHFLKLKSARTFLDSSIKILSKLLYKRLETLKKYLLLSQQKLMCITFLFLFCLFYFTSLFSCTLLERSSVIKDLHLFIFCS